MTLPLPGDALGVLGEGRTLTDFPCKLRRKNIAALGVHPVATPMTHKHTHDYYIAWLSVNVYASACVIASLVNRLRRNDVTCDAVNARQAMVNIARNSTFTETFSRCTDRGITASVACIVLTLSHIAK